MEAMTRCLSQTPVQQGFQSCFAWVSSQGRENMATPQDIPDQKMGKHREK